MMTEDKQDKNENILLLEEKNLAFPDDQKLNSSRPQKEMTTSYNQMGQGQGEILPSGLLGGPSEDVDFLQTIINNPEEQKNRAELEMIDSGESRISAPLTPDELRKRWRKAVAAIPDLTTNDPIAAVTNYAKHHLLIDIYFHIVERPSKDPEKPLYIVNAYLTDGDSIGKGSNIRKKFAKEMAAEDVLKRINEDRGLLRSLWEETLLNGGYDAQVRVNERLERERLEKQPERNKFR